MKILVTGATGFIGKAVADELRRKGHDATVQGRNRGKCQKLRDAGYTVIEMSHHSDKSIFEKACVGQDIVINCAGLSKVFGRPADFQAANVDFVAKLLGGCKTENKRRTSENIKSEEIRLIQLSSASVYFNYCNQINIPEFAALPKTLACDYTQSKYDAEQLIKQSGIRATLLRSHMVVGEGDLLIVPKLLQHLQTMGPLPMFNNGQAEVDMTSIENLVSAIVLCVDKKESIGATFNISNGQPQKLIDLLKTLSDSLDVAIQTLPISFSIKYISPLISLLEMGVKKLIHPLGYDPDLFINQLSGAILAYHFTLDNTHAKNKLGYNPKVTTKDTFDAAADWYKAQVAAPQTSSWINKKTLASAAAIGFGAYVAYHSLWNQSDSGISEMSSAAPNLTVPKLQ